jgi:hypothetical protein
LPPAATTRPSSSVDTPAQNMSWKLLSVVVNAPVLGFQIAEWVNSLVLGNALVSVDDQVRIRPSGSVAMLIGMCGHVSTGPHVPVVCGSGGPSSAPFAGSGLLVPPGGTYATESVCAPLRSK